MPRSTVCNVALRSTTGADCGGAFATRSCAAARAVSANTAAAVNETTNGERSGSISGLLRTCGSSSPRPSRAVRPLPAATARCSRRWRSFAFASRSAASCASENSSRPSTHVASQRAA
jgi:hypothetical protein